MPERQALLEAAERLEKATKELGGKFEAVDLFAHETAKAHDRTRDLTRWVIITQIALVIVTAVLGFTMVRANDANSRSQRTLEYQVANCEAGNEIRAQDKAFWEDDILAVIAPENGTPGQKAFAAKLKPKVEARYAPRDCSQVAKGQVK